ncbi:MAG: pyridoxamine 5'-phosphate oxidase family protein [Halobacteriales archaeon]
MSDVPAEAEELLTTGREMAHLATSVNDRPHAATVWYYYEDGEVEILTGGKKLENVQANPRVALSIERSENGHGQWWVVLRGTAEAVFDEDEKWAARERLFRRYRDRDPSLEEDGEPPEALVRVDVGSVAYSS